MVKILSYSRRRSKNNEEQFSGSPAWMATYGDMITQVLIFFVLLFSLSSVDAKKFDIAMFSLQESLGILDGGKVLIKGDFLEGGEVGDLSSSLKEEQELNRLQRSLKEIIKDNELAGVQISKDERGLTIRFVEGVLFDSGKAYLKEDAKIILDKIVPVLKTSHHHLRVEGHTDNLPIHTREFPSNWELSTTRAVNVVKYFVENHNFSPYILSLHGF